MLEHGPQVGRSRGTTHSAARSFERIRPVAKVHQMRANVRTTLRSSPMRSARSDGMLSRHARATGRITPRVDLIPYHRGDLQRAPTRPLAGLGHNPLGQPAATRGRKRRVGHGEHIDVTRWARPPSTDDPYK